MASKRQRDRIRLAKKIDKLLGAGARTLAKRRAEMLGPELRDDETLPDIELEIDLWLRRLDRECIWLMDIHLECTAEGAKLDGLREERNEAAAAVHDEIAYRRKLVDAAHGAGASTRPGLSCQALLSYLKSGTYGLGQPAQDPQDAAQSMKSCAGKLRSGQDSPKRPFRRLRDHEDAS